MFNMELCGQKISELRKASDMTQMELADKMNISFQAVSNWERGNSMPDISKLPELAEIFGVSIDELIGSKNPLLDSVVSDTVKQHIADNEVTSDEIKEIVEIIKPSQAENIFKNVIDVMDIKDIEDLLPFINRHAIDNLAKKLIAENKSIGDIVMFVSRDIVNELAISSYETNGMRGLDDIVPFVGRDILKQIAEKEYSKNGLRNFETVAPFLDCKYLNHLAKQAIEKDGIKAISPIAPFLDREILSEFVCEKLL